MNRRNFLRSIMGTVAAVVAAPFIPRAVKTSPVIEHGGAQFFPPQSFDGGKRMQEPFIYQYVYRNSVTGCCSDASPTSPPPHTFAFPELDVMDICREEDTGLYWVKTV